MPNLHKLSFLSGTVIRLLFVVVFVSVFVAIRVIAGRRCRDVEFHHIVRRVEERILRLEIRRADDFFTVSVGRQDDGVVGIVVRRNEVDMTVAVAVGYGPADGDVVAVVAKLLQRVVTDTVIVLLYDLVR